MEDDPSIRLEKKRDLSMFLALHMEKSPYCVAPSKKFKKTGIVVCESDRVHKVVAMTCSKAGFHAVQHMILDPPPSLSNCTVYLSRKPCTTCTTFLIQGSVSSVYYWPRAPERSDENDSEIMKDIQQADHDPNRGVGCALYSQNGYFFGAGYNGYPIGILYGNLPWHGRRKQKTGFAKREFVVHAETNALLYRSKPKVEETDVLYCTKLPCPDCQNLIKEVGIRKICYVKESSKQDKKDPSVDAKKGFDCIEWTTESVRECNEQTNDSKDNETGGSLLASLLEKEELCIFLALHMENLPSESQKSYCKTGIVICEASKPKRIIAVDCSTEDLHAVPKVLLRFPNALKGCEVYLSRMPCNYCAKLLVQAQVSQVCYWPNFEKKKEDKTFTDELVKYTNTIFSESYVIAAVFVPAINDQRKQQILVSNKRTSSDDDCIPIASIFDEDYTQCMLERLKLGHLKDKQKKKYKENLTTVKDCFKTLAGTRDEKIRILEKEKPTDEINTPKYAHALQLCDLLASRSDNNNGVGTLIFSGDKIVALGYSGYPKGSMNSLFVKKADADFDKHAVVCAEANSIIMSSERDLSNAELITTSEPCNDCLKMIQAKNIAKIVWPLRDRK